MNKFMSCQTRECGRVWEVGEVDLKLFRLISVDYSITRSSKEFNVFQVANLIAGNGVEINWEPEIYRERWLIVGTEPCCPKCGGNLDDVYVIEGLI